MHFAQFWRLESKIRCGQGWFLLSRPLLGVCLPSCSVFIWPLCVHLARVCKLCSLLLIRALICQIRDPPMRPHWTLITSIKALSPMQPATYEYWKQTFIGDTWLIKLFCYTSHLYNGNSTRLYLHTHILKLSEYQMGARAHTHTGGRVGLRPISGKKLKGITHCSLCWPLHEVMGRWG